MIRQLPGAAAVHGPSAGRRRRAVREDRDVFRGAAHDLALLFAAQGGTAVHNAALDR
jgi:hypothetical protein